MDCKRFREVLDPYADGELSPEATDAARAHLTECVACRRAESELLSLRRSLRRTVARHDPPPELVRRVEAITQPPWQRLWRRVAWQWRISLPAPTLALLLVAALILGAVVASLRRSVAPSPAVSARPAQAPAAPAQTPPGSLDFVRFDHGERATIYKVRRAPQEGAR